MVDTNTTINLTEAKEPCDSMSVELTLKDLVHIKDNSTEMTFSDQTSNSLGSESENTPDSISTDRNFQKSEYFVQSPKSDRYNILSIPNEIIDLPIFQKTERTVCILLTLPTQAVIRSIYGVTNNSIKIHAEHQVLSAYGLSSGCPFDSQTKLLPGDYCIGLVFPTVEEANKAISIKLEIVVEPISNVMLSQIIFGLYRSLGFEPSHVMKYPTKSINSGTPFYRKTRSELGKVLDEVTKLTSKIDKISLDSIDNKTQICDKIEKVQLLPAPSPSNEEINTKLEILCNSSAEIISKIEKAPLPSAPSNEEINTKLEILCNSSAEIISKIEKVPLPPEPSRSNEEINTKLEILCNSSAEIISKIEKVPLQPVPLPVSNSFNEEINAKLGILCNSNAEIILKIEKVSEIINSLVDIQDKLKEMSQDLSKGAVTENVLKQINEVQSQISHIHTHMNTKLHKNMEKGEPSVQSVTVSDIEKVLEERKVFFDKLVEAEEHIDYLQEQMEEMEKERQQNISSLTSKQHRPNFIRRDLSHSEWL